MFTTDWTALRFHDYIDHTIDNPPGKPFYREHIASRRREVHRRTFRHGSSIDGLARFWNMPVGELESDIDFLYARGLI